MVTRIHTQNPGRLFLRENRKAKGLSAKVVGERMGIERESVLRFERLSVTRADPTKLANYANAVQLTVDELRRPPGTKARPSLDALVADAPDEVVERAAAMIQLLRGTGT